MDRQQNVHSKQLKTFNALGPCATVYGSSNTGSWRIERPDVDPELCIRCGICASFCPSNVIEITDKEESIPLNIDWNYCKGCGICVNECPKGALKMIDEKEARS